MINVKKWWNTRDSHGYRPWDVAVFIFWLMLVWLIHVLFLGWFNYLFRPEAWIGKAKDIQEGYCAQAWHKDHVKAAETAARVNNPEAIVRITTRMHPIFLDNEYVYIRSPKYNVRIWDERTKIYPNPR